jgi:hypothetical protein
MFLRNVGPYNSQMSSHPRRRCFLIVVALITSNLTEELLSLHEPSDVEFAADVILYSCRIYTRICHIPVGCRIVCPYGTITTALKQV